jgi:hypothetical protein
MVDHGFLLRFALRFGPRAAFVTLMTVIDGIPPVLSTPMPVSKVAG